MKAFHCVLFLCFLPLPLLFSQTNTSEAPTVNSGKFPGAAELRAMSARYAPVQLKADTSTLSAGDRKALAELVEAAHRIDALFLKQYWEGDTLLWESLRKEAKLHPSPLNNERLHYFWLNKGPWSSLDGNKAFLPGVPEVKPEEANFYPHNMSKAEFETWLKTLSPANQAKATGFYSVIRRDPDGKLQVVPYSVAYKEDLEALAAHLRRAAALTGNASLKNFLNLRAEAFLSDDYYASDVAWMDLDAPIDVTIGPYETYNDELFGYKASFEAYVTLRDEAETAKVASFGHVLQTIENNLPIDDKYKNPHLGAMAPIRVVNQILCSGDGAHGVLTAAYNLPNDERITTERGTKRVMLRNVQQAKFDTVLTPMAAQILAKDEQSDLSFEWFFTHILAHELSHGIGPHQIAVNGRATTPRDELKELYSAIEEAKADVLGLYSLQYMMDHRQELGLGKMLPAGAAEERKLYTTYLASSFRTLGFGLHEAHGKGMAVQVNFLRDHGAIAVGADGSFAVDVEKMKTAVRELAHELLMLEATGDYEGTRKLLETQGVLRPEFAKKLAELKGIPVDIRQLESEE
jgi:hypothetical protein